MKDIDMLRQVAIHAAYEATMKTGCSPRVFAVIKDTINQRFVNCEANRRKLEDARILGMSIHSEIGYRPLVTDDPQDNVSSALNLFYVKDKSAWVRSGGPGPKYEDISLDDFTRMIAKEYDLNIAQSESDEEISMEMAELLFDGTDTIEGIIATLYTAGWAFAELRERLKHFETLAAQGLLLELPCKVGQDVYFLDRAFRNEICPATVVGIEVNGHTPQCPLWLRIEYTSEVIGKHEYLCRADMMLGKTVFLSYAEAEAALGGHNTPKPLEVQE